MHDLQQYLMKSILEDKRSMKGMLVCSVTFAIVTLGSLLIFGLPGACTPGALAIWFLGQYCGINQRRSLNEDFLNSLNIDKTSESYPKS
jgi:hypothetical protein